MNISGFIKFNDSFAAASNCELLHYFMLYDRNNNLHSKIDNSKIKSAAILFKIAALFVHNTAECL